MIELSENDWRIFRDEEQHWFPDEPEPEEDENQLYQEYIDERMEDELYGTD